MTEGVDWLFPLPVSTTAEGQVALLEQQLAADPVAAAVPDEEAEAFFAIAYTLRTASLSLLNTISRTLDLRFQVRGEQHRRMVVRAALRRWSRPAERAYLTSLPQYICLGSIPPLFEERERITLQMLANAWHGGLPIGWIIHLMRLARWDERIDEFLGDLGGVARIHHHLFVLMGKVMVRQFARRSEGAPARARPDLLSRQLRQNERQAAHLQEDYRQMADRHAAARRQGRRTAREIDALLSQAQGEVAAAEESLARRLAAQRGELAERARKQKARVEALHQEIRRTRQDFAAVLAQRTAQVGIAPLKGWRVSVTGAQADHDAYRVLVESAGGIPVAQGGDLCIELGAVARSEPDTGLFRTCETGLAAFERLLGRAVIPALSRLQAQRARLSNRTP